MDNLESSTITVHGVFLDVYGVGVLLKGESGIGKSELALGLINRGHRLVADDAVDFSLIENDAVMGTCPPLLQDFIEVRGLGLLNIRVMYGDKAIKDAKKLQLIINVVAFTPEELKSIDRLYGMYTSCNILGCEIPEVSVPVGPGRNLAVLIEGAVRNQTLKNTGYNASDEFIKRQKKIMEEDKT